MPRRSPVNGEILVGRFPLAVNGRTMTVDGSADFVRVVARASDRVVLRIQAVGTEVAELSAALGLAIEMEARLGARTRRPVRDAGAASLNGDASIVGDL